MAQTASRSTDLFLYSSVDRSDDSKRFSIDVDDSNVDVSAAQDFRFDASSYKFKSGATYFDLESRFGSLEGSTVGADNAAAIAALQTDLAAEANSRAAGDLTRKNATDAEIAARVAADAALQSALDTQEAKQESDRAASDAAIAQEATDRAAAVAAEAAARAAAITGVQGQISSILSNTDATALNSLSEIVSAFQGADQTLTDNVAGLLVRLQAVEAAINELTGSSLGS